MDSTLPFFKTVLEPLTAAARRDFVAANDSPLDSLRHPPVPVRAAWISDVHLGTRGCQAPALVGFLEHIRPATLYLNGDIWDMWKIGAYQVTKIGRSVNQRHYAPAQLTVMKKLLRLHDKGAQVIYVPGNHDEVARDWHGAQLGRFIVQNEVMHKTADGRHLLVAHGDAYDQVVRNNRALSIFGTHAKELVTRASLKLERARQGRRVNRAMEILGLSSHWSLAKALNDRLDGMNYNAAFEDAMRQDVSQRNAARVKNGLPQLDGIMLGHTHIPDERALKTQSGQPFTYYNSGDWMDPRHCTALLEGHDGKIRLVRWDDKQGIVDYQPARPITEKTISHAVNSR